MATIRQLPSVHWQVQIRLKGRKASQIFIRRDYARTGRRKPKRKSTEVSHHPDMRREEIRRVTRSDFNLRTKVLTIRDRTDPQSQAPPCRVRG